MDVRRGSDCNHKIIIIAVYGLLDCSSSAKFIAIKVQVFRNVQKGELMSRANPVRVYLGCVGGVAYVASIAITKPLCHRKQRPVKKPVSS